MKNKPSIHVKENLRRILVLIVFFIIAYGTHKFFSNADEEIIGSAFLIIFSGVLIYEYRSLFKKDLPKYEYFINIFFIIFFTIMLFGTIYSEGTKDSSNYFIENGKITNLNLSDAIYFSTVTLTTVGYGDIAPVGVYRFFAMIEIFMGLIYIGTMIYVLTKHLDGKHA